MNALLRTTALVACSLSLVACGTADRLKNIGKAPELSNIDNPQTMTGYKPVTMPMPEPQPASYSPNSLWRTGSRAFFKDQRAARIGDILTVTVKIEDKAKLENESTRSRSNTETSNLTNFWGLETTMKTADPAALVNAGSTTSNDGKGTVDRKETLVTSVAAVVTQILPNGNMVIEGKQEVRVNFELRELVVAGVVRPEDIDSSNTIDSTKIAFARIGYGGRGQITDVQQPRWGQQIYDAIAPW